MATLVRLAEDAYGKLVRQHIEERTGRSVALSRTQVNPIPRRPA